MQLLPTFGAIALAGSLVTSTATAQVAFARIEATTQAARDTERQAILMQEQNDETKLLLAAEKTLAGASTADKDKLALDVERHRKNLAALSSEIQRMKGMTQGENSPGPVRLKAASAAKPGSQNTARAEAISEDVPYWDVYRRRASTVAK